MKFGRKKANLPCCCGPVLESPINSLVERFREDIPDHSESARIIDSRGARRELITVAQAEGYGEFARTLSKLIKLARSANGRASKLVLSNEGEKSKDW